MPAAVDRDEDKERDREARDHDRSKGKAPPSKGKDVSHVPCKFFKVGSCTAGSSCPFSHTATDPGQKDVCAWYVKGNCKFSHKCALAHILPGQPMSMDRKNKKAAQMANSGSGGRGDGPGSKDGRDARSDGPAKGRRRDMGGKPQLLTGTTAPTRPGRSLMALKATISPSAPAPPLKDTDFMGVLDEEVKLASAPARGSPTTPSGPKDAESGPSKATTTEDKPTASVAKRPENDGSPSPAPLPVNSPRRTAANSSNGSPNVDFGPIGSPPRTGPATAGLSTSRVNGFSPGTSPNNNNNTKFLSTSPFSAPGSQSVFAANNASMRGGIAASLGSGLAMSTRWDTYSSNEGYDTGIVRSVSGTRAGEYDINIEYERVSATAANLTNDTAVDDGDLEDFIPSSLTELLTPEERMERSRRMSRGGHGQSPTLSPGILGNSASGAVNGGQGHRHSRSVPSTSLLGEMANIWSDSNGGGALGGIGGIPGSPGRLGELGNGTPNSFNKSPLQSTFGGRADELGVGMGSPSPSMLTLSPTNASAAFLPGIHSSYLKAKQQQQLQNMSGSGNPPLGPGIGGTGGLGVGLGPALGRGVGVGMRGASNPLYGSNGLGTGGGGAISKSIGNYLQAGPVAGLSSSPSSAQVHTFARATPYDPSSAAPGIRPIPTYDTAGAYAGGDGYNGAGGYGRLGGENGDGGPMLSPNTRALQQHAPGQSLPQGLAAGYSRIHALPPLASPGSSAMGASISPGPGTLGGMTEWATLDHSPGYAVANSGQTTGNLSSYSAVAAPRTVMNSYTNPPGTPPGLGRNVSGGAKGSTLSPLRGVLNNGEDDLFDMEN
ncbi:hypothetical protein PC9H_008805 [Pleurotus ostreatus]|uniref:C3H1-type domain-containing protein n=2 Tax=Pleurotus TaxID=5320 RepID=A0A8H7DQX1_PLEOS|nr:uncharacterized protein PC9H_008805 [Pleurotus ostreatus]KAF7426437.1 hypothetical protein PC9H_008805 [Pleurotus ostreatus]KAG9221823.1 hypothetical protein CCMSSC00406_0005648 [Pleurotus cornucopiae]